MSPERRSKYILAVLLFLLVIGPLFTGGIRMLVDWIWFRQEGFGVLFTNVLKGQIAIGGLAGVGFILIVGLNLVIAQALSHSYGHQFAGGGVGADTLDRVTYGMRWMVWLAVLVVGYGLSHWGMAHWQEYLLARNTVPMGASDPLFGLDLSFFCFSFPSVGSFIIWRK